MNRDLLTPWRWAALLWVVGLAFMAGAPPAGALSEKGPPSRFHQCAPFVDDPAYTVCQDIVVLSRAAGSNSVSVVYHLTVENTVWYQDEVVFWDKTSRKMHWLYKDGEEHEFSVQDRRTFELYGERSCVRFQFHYANSQEQFFRADRCS